MIAQLSPSQTSQLQNIAVRLTKRGLRLATAESCTGGGLGAILSSIPGSSDWFVGGIIAYSNDVKQNVLAVSPRILASDGAVSEACARDMAVGGRRVCGADLCVSITGIAGPGGGSREKPVGTVCFALASADRCQSVTQNFAAIGRAQVRAASAGFALDLISAFLATTQRS